jgi:hypothetical protein
MTRRARHWSRARHRIALDRDDRDAPDFPHVHLNRFCVIDTVTE